MKIRDLFKKYKIKAKKLYTVIMLSALEIVIILWCNNWAFTPAILPVFIQLAFIFENRDVWARLSEEEKKEITLSEEELDNFVEGIEKAIKDGKSSKEILAEIKKD